MKNRSAYVGTFHKTGTVLLGKIFGQLHRDRILTLWRSDWVEEEPETWDVNFHYHSAFMFGDAYSNIPRNAKIVISLRDPRDLVVSAARYHCDSEEDWLKVPQEKFAGLTYQEKMNSLATWEDKLLFEMRNSSGNTIKKMLQISYDDPRVLPVKLEELMVDRSLTVFLKMFRHLGLEGANLEKALRAAEANSLFSSQKSRHSRGGYPCEWRERMSRPVQREFERIFPGGATRLGYAN